MKLKSIAVLAVIAAIVVACALLRSQATPGSAPAAVPIPEPGNGLPGILDFGQGTCLPCQQMMPVLEELARKHEGKIVVRYLDTRIPENQDRADMYRIRVIPTQIFLDAKGEEIIRHEGFFALEEIELELEELEWIPRR